MRRPSWRLPRLLPPLRPRKIRSNDYPNTAELLHEHLKLSSEETAYQAKYQKWAEQDRADATYYISAVALALSTSSVLVAVVALTVK